jgi:hypothetical protein
MNCDRRNLKGLEVSAVLRNTLISSVLGGIGDSLVLVLFSSELFNYLSRTRTRPYPELGVGHGDASILLLSSVGGQWSLLRTADRIHTRNVLTHAPTLKPASTHPVPQLGGGGNQKRVNESQQQKSVNWGCDDHLCFCIPPFFMCLLLFVISGCIMFLHLYTSGAFTIHLTQLHTNIILKHHIVCELRLLFSGYNAV